MSSVSGSGGQTFTRRVVALILLVLAVAFLVAGVIYVTTPASAEPAFLGHIKGSTGHHALRMTASFIVGGACLIGSALAFFRQPRPADEQQRQEEHAEAPAGE